MGNAAQYIPAFRFGHKVYPQNLIDGSTPVETGDVWFVDGDKTTGGGGQSWEDAFATVVAAEAAASAGDVIYVAGKTMAATDTDPSSYTENLTINTPQLSVIGVSRGRTQGGLPQLKVGTTTTSPIITIAAPGVLIANLGLNGTGATGGGILFDDDGGSTKSAFGASIVGCHFKNCVGTTATNAATGGAVQWAATGGAWQVLISGNRFYKNVGDVVLKGTTGSVPQDVIIENNIFSGPASSVDCNLYLAGGSGINGVVIDSNIFQQLPAIGSGSVVRFIDATGCVGMLTRNMFGALTSEGSSEKTFEAAGTGAKIPTTVHMAGNYGQFETGVGAGLISGEIFA